MTNEEIVGRLAEVEARSKSNTHRLDALEKMAEEMHTMNASLAVMNSQMQASTKALEGLSARVAALEKIPGSRWEKIVGTVITVACGAVIGALFALIVKGA